VVGVDDQEQVEGVDGVGVDLVSFAGDANIICRKFSAYLRWFCG